MADTRCKELESQLAKTTAAALQLQSDLTDWQEKYRVHIAQLREAVLSLLYAIDRQENLDEAVKYAERALVLRK